MKNTMNKLNGQSEIVYNLIFQSSLYNCVTVKASYLKVLVKDT